VASNIPKDYAEEVTDWHQMMHREITNAGELLAERIEAG